jgi:hypothetical protein
MRKIARTTLFATTVAFALYAGAVSARQLRSEAQTTCSGRCASTADCATGCACSFTHPSSLGFCSKHLAGVVPSGK